MPNALTVGPPPTLPPDITFQDGDAGDRTDLEQAEAIATGQSMLLPERRHLVACLEEIQRLRGDVDLLKDVADMALAVTDLAIARSGVPLQVQE